MKRRLFTISTLLVAILLCAALAYADTAAITVEGFSANKLTVQGITGQISTGLKVIGNGEMIYLVGMEATGKEVSAYAWSITAAPTGSAATLSSTDQEMVMLVPDKVGQYTVKLVITTAAGDAETTIVVTSAEYVGVGGVGGLPVDFAKGQCALCHFDKNNEWKETGHANLFREGIDGIASDHYGANCISCHTVGYNTAATAVNGGFDDVMAEVGWVFPAVPAAGEWDKLVANFPKLAHLGSIQCENCHGPGSLHKGDKSKTDVSLSSDVCAICHDAPTHHIKTFQYDQSAHAVGVASASTRSGCADCHSGYGAIKMMSPNSKLAMSTGSAPTSCQVCHEPHSDANDHQIRKMDDVTLLDGTEISWGGYGKLCMNCHHARRNGEEYAANPANISTHFGPHGSAQADMLAGANGIHYGMPTSNSNHWFVLENACVTCHMSATPAEGEPGNNHVGEHTFAMAWTDPETGEDIDNVGVCRTCHGPINSFEDIKAAADYDEDGTVEAAADEIEGLLEELGELLPPAGPTVVTTPEDYSWADLTDEGEIAHRKLMLKAAYNYFFVEEDLSGGIHNVAYAATLLRRSIASLTIGDLGSGMIEGISDIPMDQGKQVRISWGGFAGDGISDEPVQKYNIWRRVDDPAVTGLGKKVPVIPNLESIKGDLKPGDRVAMETEMWDFVGTVPAAGMETYSAVVPTLWDSTKTDGMHWSVFVVTGHTSVPYWYKVTAPDSGYSIDNLAPGAPANVASQLAQGGIGLTWEESADADFKYFAVYRGTTTGFNPAGSEPLALLSATEFTDTAVQTGQTYYYKVAAIDFSGNTSAYSAETSVMVTGVLDASAVPTDFVLEQNYPNPFNPSTTISFGLPSMQRVTLRIYNLQGAVVRTLANGAFAAGHHRLMWDGRDDNGLMISAGTYVYRIESESAALTKKMIYLK